MQITPKRSICLVPVSLDFDQTPPCLDSRETLITAKIFLFLRAGSMGYFNSKIEGKANANA
jgi:hypothetical protein